MIPLISRKTCTSAVLIIRVTRPPIQTGIVVPFDSSTNRKFPRSIKVTVCLFSFVDSRKKKNHQTCFDRSKPAIELKKKSEVTVHFSIFELAKPTNHRTEIFGNVARPNQ